MRKCRRGIKQKVSICRRVGIGLLEFERLENDIYELNDEEEERTELEKRRRRKQARAKKCWADG